LKNKDTYARSSLSSKSREYTKRGSLRVNNDGKLTRRSSFQQVTTNKDGGKNNTGQRSIIPRTEPVNSCDKKDSKKQEEDEWGRMTISKKQSFLLCSTTDRKLAIIHID